MRLSFSSIQSAAADGLKDGLTLYGASKTFQVADLIASSVIGKDAAGNPKIPSMVRQPAVGLAIASLFQGLIGGKIAKLAMMVAFEQAIAALADPAVNAALAPVASALGVKGLGTYGMGAYAMGAYAPMRGMGDSSFQPRVSATRGMTALVG